MASNTAALQPSFPPNRKMARNRKYQSAALRFGPALKAFLLCLLIGGSGVGYVWQKNQIYELADQIRKREPELAALESQNETLRKQLARLYSPAWLEMQNKKLNLGLISPQPSQIWPLNEPGPEDAARSQAGAQIAGRQTSGPNW